MTMCPNSSGDPTTSELVEEELKKHKSKFPATQLPGTYENATITKVEMFNVNKKVKYGSMYRIYFTLSNGERFWLTANGRFVPNEKLQAINYYGPTQDTEQWFERTFVGIPFKSITVSWCKGTYKQILEVTSAVPDLEAILKIRSTSGRGSTGQYWK